MASKVLQSGAARPLDPPESGFVTRPWRQSDGLIAIAIVVGTLIAYAPTFHAGYIWDDDQYLTQNRYVQSPGGIGAIWALDFSGGLTTPRSYTPQYYPLVFSSFWFEHRLWGLNPLGYHLSNLLLHIANAFLVWRVLSRIPAPAAGFIALAFAVHPLQVESVAWITERKNVLSATFYLLAMWCWLDSQNSPRPWKGRALLCLFFVAALLSKTVTCTLPAVLILIDLFRHRRIRWAEIGRLAPLLIVGVLFGLMTAQLERHHVGASGAEWNDSLPARAFFVAPRAYLTYFQHAWLPYPLMFIYPRWTAALDPLGTLLPMVLFCALIVGALVATRRSNWGIPLLAAFCLITLAPAVGFFNVYPHRYSWVADHFSYLGTIGWLALVVLIVRGVTARLGNAARSAQVVIATLATIAWCGLSCYYARSFANAQTLWENTLQRNPNAWIAMQNLGVMYLDQGREADAVRLFQNAAQHPQAVFESATQLGQIAAQHGRFGEAIAEFEKARAAEPNDVPTLTNLGLALAESGQIEAGLPHLQRAAQLDPKYSPAWRNLADLLSRRGRFAAAADALAHAVELEPANAELRAGLQALRRQARESGPDDAPLNP